MSPAPALTIENLHIGFQTPSGLVEAVRGVSLSLNQGDIIGIVGESGSGKSVTALSLLKLLPPARVLRKKGTITLLGRDLDALTDTDIQDMRGRDASMIFQEPMTALNPVRRIAAQMCEVIERHTDLSRKDSVTRGLALLSEMQITDPHRIMESFPHQLSGGLRQRVLIAMAFACDPKLIIADEPTTALDVTVQAEILRLLKEKARDRNASIIFISHDLAVISQLCDRVYVMLQGRIVEHGATARVIHAPRHDYTKALLEAMPGKTPKRHKHASPGDLLTLKNVGLTFPAQGKAASAHQAVKGVELKLGQGQTLGLVGESGCGKTSLAKIAAGLIRPSSGAVIYRDQDITFNRRLMNRQDISMVFQDPYSSLNPRLRIWRALSEPLIARRRMPRDKRRAAAETLLQMVGLDADMMDRFPHAFSGGQRQRIAIARALAGDPKILILDEPTSALDVSVQARILDLLQDLQDKKGLSYLLVSHDIAVVSQLSDDIAVMHQGRIVESGAANSILSNPQNTYTKALFNAAPHLISPPAKY